MSAARSSVSGSVPSVGQMAIPMLAPTSTHRSPILIGAPNTGDDAIGKPNCGGAEFLFGQYGLEDDAEFIATETRYRVGLPDNSANADRHLTQDLVAGLVTMNIVDRLKPVQVDDQNCKRRAAAIALLPCRLKSFAKDAPIGQPCQGVMPGKRLSQRLSGFSSLVRFFERGNVSAVGPLLLLGGSRFRQLEAGDVGVRADDPGDAAVGHPLDRPAAAQDPYVVPIPVPLAILKRIVGQFSGVLSIRLLKDALTVVGVNARQPRLARPIDFLFQTEAAHLPPRARIEDFVVLQIVVPDALTSAFEREIPPALALRECGIGAFALGDIAANADDADDFILLVAQRQFAGRQPSLFARDSEDELLDVDRGLAGADHSLFVGEELASKLRWVKLEIGLADQVLRPQTEVPGNSDVGDDETARGVFDEQIVRHLVDYRAKQCAFGLEFLFSALARGDVPRPADQSGDLAAVAAVRSVKLVRIVRANNWLNTFLGHWAFSNVFPHRGRRNR